MHHYKLKERDPAAPAPIPGDVVSEIVTTRNGKRAEFLVFGKTTEDAYAACAARGVKLLDCQRLPYTQTPLPRGPAAPGQPKDLGLPEYAAIADAQAAERLQMGSEMGLNPVKLDYFLFAVRATVPAGTVLR